MNMKTANIQSKSHNVEMGFSLPLRTAHKGKNLLPEGEQYFPLREVPILKRDAIDNNHCSLQ